MISLLTLDYSFSGRFREGTLYGIKSFYGRKMQMPRTVESIWQILNDSSVSNSHKSDIEVHTRASKRNQSNNIGLIKIISYVNSPIDARFKMYKHVFSIPTTNGSTCKKIEELKIHHNSNNQVLMY